jgi:hypothetical protein
LLNPDPEVIRLVDIAHALSMIPVLGGHSAIWYPLALHAVHASRVALAAPDALGALFGCAARAYTFAIPMSIILGIGRDIDISLQQAIVDRFQIPPYSEAMRSALGTAHATERRDLLFDTSNASALADPTYSIDPTIVRTPKKAETAFIDRYEELLVSANQLSFL